MPIARLIKDNPQFHQYNGGDFTSWALHPDTLRFIYSILTPGMSTLETGCGHTTVVFSIAKTKHISITPDLKEAERVKQYCAELDLGKDITFIIESSDIALPCNPLIPATLDFIIIDGAHRFPFPIIDWYYTAHRLKEGGIICVDDFKMPSVRILYDFLCIEDEWESIETVHNTAFFRKLRKPSITGADWQLQKINLTYQVEQEQSQSQLQQTQEELTQSQSQLQQIKTELIQARNTISTMEASIFWKLKKTCFKVIRFFGFMPND
jgi:hypothetical protein